MALNIICFRLKKFGVKLICVDLESNEMLFIYYLKLLENYDFIFTSDSILASNIYKYFNINAEFIPFVYSKDHYFPKKMEKIFDGSFIGQNTLQDLNLLKVLNNQVLKLKLWSL